MLRRLLYTVGIGFLMRKLTGGGRRHRTGMRF